MEIMRVNKHLAFLILLHENETEILNQQNLPKQHPYEALSWITYENIPQ
jgi:hypothetical protein